MTNINIAYAGGMMWDPFWFFGFGALGIALFSLLALAVIALKGYCLWTAAKRDEKGWFIALLIINTFGIFELIYLYFIVKLWDKPHHHAHEGEHHHTSAQ